MDYQSLSTIINSPLSLTIMNHHYPQSWLTVFHWKWPSWKFASFPSKNGGSFHSYVSWPEDMIFHNFGGLDEHPSILTGAIWEWMVEIMHFSFPLMFHHFPIWKIAFPKWKIARGNRLMGAMWYRDSHEDAYNLINHINLHQPLRIGHINHINHVYIYIYIHTIYQI